METHNGVNGNWRDVTGECKSKLRYMLSNDAAPNGYWAEIHHGTAGADLVALLGHRAPHIYRGGGHYRITLLTGNYPCGGFRVEHFEPAPPEYGWVDVTDECTARFQSKRVDLMCDGIVVALVGHRTNVDCGTSAKDYRVTTIPDQHDTFAGNFKVERWQEIE